MKNQTDFMNILWDFLFTYRQFLLNGFLHKRVIHDVYEKNPATWNTFLLSLESGAVVGLYKLLERKEFENLDGGKLDETIKKVKNIRNAYMAHNDLSRKRDDVFLKANQSFGSEIIDLFNALKERLIQYQQKLGMQIDVQKLFTDTQNNALHDLNSWLKSFKVEL